MSKLLEKLIWTIGNYDSNMSIKLKKKATEIADFIRY